MVSVTGSLTSFEFTLILVCASLCGTAEAERGADCAGALCVGPDDAGCCAVCAARNRANPGRARTRIRSAVFRRLFMVLRPNFLSGHFWRAEPHIPRCASLHPNGT